MAAANDALLLEIARCSNVRRCFESTRLLHPCSTVVADQRVSFDDFHLPEPWNGQIETAPILFVCCNPSWRRSERFPTFSWDDEAIVRFFRTRYEHSGEASQTWREILGIATRLLGRAPKPGVDYAVTDAVRCKSHNRAGVKQALSECSGRYLRRTLGIAGARVVIALGKDAHKSFATYFDVPNQIGVHGLVRVGDRDRMLVLLGAPGGPQRRKLTDEETQRVRAVLR